MRKNLNVIAAYTIMMGLIILVGIFQSWNIALSIFNLSNFFSESICFTLKKSSKY